MVFQLADVLDELNVRDINLQIEFIPSLMRRAVNRTIFAGPARMAIQYRIRF